MSELFKIVLTSSITVLGGIMVFAVGQIIVKFFIEPIHAQSRLRGEIADSLIFYAPFYCNPATGDPREEDEEASRVLRQHASQLMARTCGVPWYDLWERLKLVRKEGDVIEAARRLIGLSNSVPPRDLEQVLRNLEWRKEIGNLLGIMTE